jgi:serine/threonine protein kinase
VVAGKYRIERLIGRGAMGAVFSARHTILDKRVALKVMLAAQTSAEEAHGRFFNEARAAASLESEHVARVLDVGELPNGAFMALELLEGADLEQLMAERGPLPVHDVVDWVLQALEAIAEAHALGIVHRDLKPSNLFVANRRDGTRTVKVLDFGIAKQTRPMPTHGSFTVTMAVLGSPAYMAPEQLRSAKGVDARTDVWSIGVVLYELLTGRLPFPARDFPELVHAVFEQAPPSLRGWRADLPPALEDAVLRCLTRDPVGRFQDVAALADALAPFAPSGPAHPSVNRIRHVVRTAAQWTQPSTPPRRRQLGTRVAAAAVAAGIIAAAAGWLGARHGTHPSEHQSPPVATSRTGAVH